MRRRHPRIHSGRGTVAGFSTRVAEEHTFGIVPAGEAEIAPAMVLAADRPQNEEPRSERYFASPNRASPIACAASRCIVGVTWL